MKNLLFVTLFIATHVYANCIGEAQMFPTKVKSAQEDVRGCKIFVTSLNLNFNPFCPLDDMKAWFDGIYTTRCPEVGSMVSGILVDDGDVIRLY